jgi:hypothetical protein
MPQGALPVSIDTAEGTKSALNLIAASVTLLKSGGGRLDSVAIITPESTTTLPTATFYDSSTTAGTATANVFYVTALNPAAGAVLTPNFPFQNGCVCVVNAVGVVSAFYQ